MPHFESDGRMVVLRGIIIRYSKKRCEGALNYYPEDELVEYKRGIHRVHRKFVFVPLGAPFLTYCPAARIPTPQVLNYALLPDPLIPDLYHLAGSGTN